MVAAHTCFASATGPVQAQTALRFPAVAAERLPDPLPGALALGSHRRIGLHHASLLGIVQAGGHIAANAPFDHRHV